MGAGKYGDFWSKARPDANGCWLWQGMTGGGSGGDPYGRFKVNGRPTMAHRIAWERTYGPIPEGMLVCHRCDVRLCVSDHLFLGAPADNSADMVAKGRSYDRRGERNPHRRLTDAQVAEIKRLKADGAASVTIAARFGVARQHVWRIATGRIRIVETSA